MSFKRDGVQSRRGFTLIELLVVITVLAILASLVSPMVFRNVGDARATAAQAQLEVFALALDTYRLDNDYYPGSDQGLQSLVLAPTGTPPARNWRGPYLTRGLPLDPWGRPYTYRSPVVGTDDYEVGTLGRDGREGGSGEDADRMRGTVAAAAAP